MKKVSEILTSKEYLNGQFFRDGVVRKTVLGQPNCNHEKKVFTLRIIPTNKNNSFWPKYIPQIKASCGNCGRYIKFAVQTPELMDRFNRKLEGIRCG